MDMERMWQHSCGGLLPVIYVIIGEKLLGMDPPFGSGPNVRLLATVPEQVYEADACAPIEAKSLRRLI